VRERPVPQATTKVTDCGENPQTIDAVLTPMTNLADKTSSFGSGP
jgi:hypothetical protein